ncbi:hypothetical protein TIFTF001_029851 [Ficus carica]|uniref:Retrotransposon gag domain-containing protein n=1 Tax=Ficus carica TaxID=3494 RepID=A0AA88DSN1_FICCA|nr:hypothetical protein TIFTF001_029851 [Ficus carica]
MIETTLHQESRDAIMCKLFPQILKGSVLKWFCQLEPATISSFKEMTKVFLENYSANIYMGMTCKKLYKIVHRLDESLRAFIKQFNKVIAVIPNCHDTIALFALKKGLFSGPSYTPFPPPTKKIIGAIFCGSILSGDTCTSIKKHIRKASSSPPSYLPDDSPVDHIILFHEKEATKLCQPHGDVLVSSLLIANCQVGRIMVDNESLADILFLVALKEIDIDLLEKRIRYLTAQRKF